MKPKKFRSRHCLPLTFLFMSALICGPQAADTVNYDTAWTFVYDGGKTTSGRAIPDKFGDVKILPTGEAVCVGETADSAEGDNLLLIKLSVTGKALETRVYGSAAGLRGASLLIAKNGDFIVGGYKYSAPFLLRLDPAFNKKYSTWYYDSTLHKPILSRSVTINSMVETKDGRILTAGGDAFPDNNGYTLNNYAALLQYDSLGAVKFAHEWLNTTGYELAGWSLTPAEGGGYVLGGNQSVFLLDTLGQVRQKVDYSFSLPGVGTEVNNVTRVHQLRNGMVMVAGQSYEEDCWTKYQRLYYDAWWSPLGLSGNDDFRYTAGVSGADDFLFDFTQLIDGRIAFIGGKGGSPAMGIWVFVTDSTGKTIQWENEYDLPGLDNGWRRNNIMPLSIAATPDSGFILVGFEGASNLNNNACAFKFVPKSLPAPVLNRTAHPSHHSIAHKNWTFTFNAPSATDASLELFTLQGKRVRRIDRHISQAGQGEIQVDASALNPGAYVWQLRVCGKTTQGFIPKAE